MTATYKYSIEPPPGSSSTGFSLPFGLLSYIREDFLTVMLPVADLTGVVDTPLVLMSSLPLNRSLDERWQILRACLAIVIHEVLETLHIDPHSSYGAWASELINDSLVEFDSLPIPSW
jgi:hypothetical protein